VAFELPLLLHAAPNKLITHATTTRRWALLTIPPETAELHGYRKPVHAVTTTRTIAT